MSLKYVWIEVGYNEKWTAIIWSNSQPADILYQLQVLTESLLDKIAKHISFISRHKHLKQNISVSFKYS